MTKKRYNIWLDTVLIDEIKRAASTIGVKVSTYMRMAILEKLRGDRHDRSTRTREMGTSQKL